MIIPIVVLSTIFIAMAFIINSNTAPYLLSGYNTLSPEEQQKIDIQSYLAYFKKFHIVLGISLFVFSLVIYYGVDSDWTGIFLAAYPILAYIYLIWKSNQFTTEPNKKQTLINYGGMVVLIVILGFILYEFKGATNDNGISLTHQQLTITGEYGTTIPKSNLKSITLIDVMPNISRKTNGFSLETIKKGYFETASGEEVTLLINSAQMPMLLITTKDQHKIYYSAKEQSNEVLYKNLCKELNL